jgi:hypothetical protein
MATIVTQIFSPTSYNPSDEVLLNPSITQSIFDPSQNYIEYTIQTLDESFTTTDYSYNRYSFPKSGVTSNDIGDIIISPENDIANYGFTSGEYNVYYNFLKNELNTSFSNRSFYIKEISADRTEVILGYTTDQVTTITDVNNFKTQLNSNPNYFQDFYLNFGENNLIIANNIAVNNETFDVLINLYEALPLNINVKDTLWIVTQIANELTFNITFTPEVIIPTITTFPLSSPNFNLDVKDQTNNSTGYVTYESLITSSLLSTSYSQLNNLISSSGIEIGIDYTDFSNFIHFSSAVTRINNFYYKKQLIDQYQQEINILNGITSLVTSSNISILTNKINNIIENFDGYEYFLYYDTGSYSYPKSGSTVPYTLYPAGAPEVRSWLGDIDNLTGILGSASIYDQNNLDYLYNTIPNFIQEDPQNDPYKLFVEMVAQSYDNIWIYYKDVTNRYNADNRLDSGISKDLVANALRSFGVKLYQNNFSTNDLYSAFLGYGAINPETTGSTPVTAGSGQEYIKNYITASYDASVMPLDDVNKETYKRLYHNLPYLAKTKGTIPGLRALINCFGIPDTILRISEFGGRDKDTSTYDYFDQVYNYKLVKQEDRITTSWNLNSTNWGVSYPQSVQFRFKLDPITSSAASAVPAYQSLFSITDSELNITSSLVLEYTGSWKTSSSYSGSTYSSSYQYANLVFYPDITDIRTIDISLPFFNNDWWSVMLNYNSISNKYELYAGSKGYYNGYDGNQIEFLASSSTDIDRGNWDTGNIAVLSETFSIVGPRGTKNYRPLSGSYQELRYWNRTNDIEDFKDFIMNPSSITFSNNIRYYNYLAFRLPLGNELYTGSKSVHPKITGSWDSYESFSDNSSNAAILNNSYTTNIEPFFYDQPIAGIKNRVTDKIQIVSSSYPTGSVLSQYRSLEQTYPTLGSETPDINLLEVAFSPQNEINNDIIASLGYFNIGEYIGDPRQISSSATTYPDLDNLSNRFFQKYFASYNLFDYIRLIKYFDNSLFKMIKDFVPARTSLASGVVIKQHLLERNKYPQPQVSWEELDYSGSITTAFMSGGTGGTFDSYNFTGSIIPPTFINNTQSWGEEVKTPVGLLTISHSTQDEFYNGELPNSLIIATDGELNPNNPFKQASTEIIEYKIVQYENNAGGTYTFPAAINESFFLSSTIPNPGSINTWFDDGGLTNPGNTRTITPGKFQTFFDANKTNGVKWIKINRVDNNGLDRSDLISQATTLSFEFLNGFKTYNIATIQEQTYGYLLGIGPYAPGSMNNFNTGSVNTLVFLSVTSGSTIFNPSVPNFDYSEYNPLLDNAEIPQTSVFFMDIDYSQNPVIPINQFLILSGSADRAQVQDSNYNSYSWSGIRYNGSKYNSVKFN